jgi:ribulose-5-phosphate 4-epimerase/fuculose-1-phosphate aldolase
VTPSNYDYEKMRVEDICIVDFTGAHVPDGSGTGLAPVDRVRDARQHLPRAPDVNAIVHTHQPYASALAVLRKPIPALSDEQVRFLGRRVAVVDYAPSGTGFLARNVQKKVAGGDNAFILANHGIVALGTDPDRAVFNMALLEKGLHRLPHGAGDRVGQGVHDPRPRSARSPSASCAPTRSASPPRSPGR